MIIIKANGNGQVVHTCVPHQDPTHSCPSAEAFKIICYIITTKLSQMGEHKTWHSRMRDMYLIS